MVMSNSWHCTMVIHCWRVKEFTSDLRSTMCYSVMSLKFQLVSSVKVVGARKRKFSDLLRVSYWVLNRYFSQI